MTSPMKRSGLSVSAKMFVTTTALILAVVALFGILNVSHMAKVFDEQARKLADVTIENLHKRGDIQTRDLVQAGKTAVLNNDYSTLQSFIPQLASSDDPALAYAFVADQAGTILAHTDPQKNSLPVSDEAGRSLLADPSPKGREFAATRLLGFSRPIEHDGRRAGTVVIAFRLAPLDESLAQIRAEKVRTARATYVRTALLGVMFVLFGSALAVFQGMRISLPLTRLSASADRIARGDLGARAEVSSGDEVGRLGESFNYMANQLVILLEETREKAVLEKELETARVVQEALVPASDVFELGSIKVCGYFVPSSQVGGDWWTVNALPDGKLLIAIGDVTGHGTPAAMITAAAKAACDTARHLTGARLTVSTLLEAMNVAVFESGRRRFVMTCFAAILDPLARTITYSNAGHNFPYLYRAHGPADPNASDGNELQVLMSRGNPLGDDRTSAYAEKVQPLEAGDVLVWYTDGVVECESEGGEEFGEKRFRQAIRAAAGLDPQSMRDELVRVTRAFYGAQPCKDDITMVFARVNG
jgi:serine phosphatase RsbU (regulator of sigma subunit)